MQRLKKYLRSKKGEKGFTLIELLVVVAILGVLAAIAIPNVGSFINEGKTESYSSELHNVQTAVMAVMVKSDSGLVDFGINTPQSDMSLIGSDVGTGNVTVATYMTGLDGTTVKTPCRYSVTANGTVTQSGCP